MYCRVEDKNKSDEKDLCKNIFKTVQKLIRQGNHYDVQTRINLRRFLNVRKAIFFKQFPDIEFGLWLYQRETRFIGS